MNLFSLAVPKLVFCGALLTCVSIALLLSVKDMDWNQKGRRLLAPFSLLMLGLSSMAGVNHWPLLAVIIFSLAGFSGAVLSLVIAYYYWPVDIEAGRRRRTQVIEELRSEGLYPLEGQNATDDDVKKLLRSNNRIYAVGLYREIHHVSLKEAATAIQGMKQELNI